MAWTRLCMEYAKSWVMDVIPVWYLFDKGAILIALDGNPPLFCGRASGLESNHVLPSILKNSDMF